MTEQQTGLLLTTIGVLAVVPDSLVLRLVSFDTLPFIGLRAGLAATVIIAALALWYRGRTLAQFTGLGRAGLLYAALFAGSTFAFLFALRLTSIANGLFIISTSPVFAALLSRAFLGERLSRRMVWTTLFALIGIAIIAAGSLGAEGGRGRLLGDVIALCAACSLAGAFTTARAARHISMIPAGALAYVMTALIALPVAGIPQGSQLDWTLMLMLGAVFIPIGTSLLSVGPRYITAPEVSLLLLLEAVLAPILVWWVVGEDPGPHAIAGGALVLATLFVSNLIALRKGRPA